MYKKICLQKYVFFTKSSEPQKMDLLICLEYALEVWGRSCGCFGCIFGGSGSHFGSYFGLILLDRTTETCEKQMFVQTHSNLLQVRSVEGTVVSFPIISFVGAYIWAADRTVSCEPLAAYPRSSAQPSPFPYPWSPV